MKQFTPAELDNLGVRLTAAIATMADGVQKIEATYSGWKYTVYREGEVIRIDLRERAAELEPRLRSLREALQTAKELVGHERAYRAERGLETTPLLADVEGAIAKWSEEGPMTTDRIAQSEPTGKGEKRTVKRWNPNFPANTPGENDVAWYRHSVRWWLNECRFDREHNDNGEIKPICIERVRTNLRWLREAQQARRQEVTS